MVQRERLWKKKKSLVGRTIGRNPMSVKAFRRITLSNFLLTTFVFSLLPPLYFKAGIHIMAVCLLMFALGVILVGPMNAWMVEHFSRKKVFVYAGFFTFIPSLILLFYPIISLLVPAFFLQGISYAITQNALCHTTANDILVSDNRTRGDNILFYSTHLALALGLLLGSVGLMKGKESPFEQLGCWVTGSPNTDLQQTLTLMKLSMGGVLSLCIGICAVLLALRIKVPVKAPIKVAKFSCDRFWRKRAWPLFVATFFIAIIEGIFIEIVLTNSYLPLYISTAYMALGFVIMYFVQDSIFRYADDRAEIVSGCLLLIAAQFVLLVGPGTNGLEIMPNPSSTYVKVSFVLFGAGITMVINRLQMYFLKFSGHCCRATSQNTHFLGWLLGMFIGLALSSFYLIKVVNFNRKVEQNFISALSRFSDLRIFTEHGGIGEMSGTAMLLTIVFLALYLFVINPWFKKNKDREFKFRGY